ncbi:RimK/LysX family protein [Photobacterium kagoshimensis]|uniref:putative ATP-dependent zinc protease n=1 Tax=Photobacterium kagoshimensis TaxID=2910242 RepID=UPI003D0F1EB9
MKKVAVGLFALLLAGCAQQQAIQEPVKPVPETEKPAEVKPTDPVQPEVAPEIKPEVKPEVKPTPEIKPKPKPKPVTTTKDGKLILGSQEIVWLGAAKTHVKVKVDSKVKMSTIGVSDIQEFERDGKDWVKIKAGKEEVELPVERWVKSNKERLPIVKVRTRLADLNERTEFMLVKGNGVVLGENFIQDVAVIDANRKFVQPKSK